MSSFAQAQDEIARYFGKNNVPPISFVGWLSPESTPIEIELVAWGGPANNEAKNSIEFLTPPGMTTSPVFSRVTRIHRGSSIFIGDIASPFIGTAGEPLRIHEEVQIPFDTLEKLLTKTGSDFNHLAKATYYVTDDEISKAHNAIRPKYYDPARPPAASKATVIATGHPGSRYVMDMIAVPKEK